MDDTETLLEKYRPIINTVTQEELAEIERKLWESTSSNSEIRRKYKRYEWLMSVFGGQSHSYQIRERLSLPKYRGEHKELWRRIDQEGMLISTAHRLLGKARDMAEESHRPYREMLAAVLIDYDSNPVVKYGNGRKSRRRPMGPRKSPEEREKEEERLRRELIAKAIAVQEAALQSPEYQEYVVVQEPVTPVPVVVQSQEPVAKALPKEKVPDDNMVALPRKKKEPKTPYPAAKGKKFYSKVKNLTNAYMADRLVGTKIESITLFKIQQSFEIGLKVLFDEFAEKIHLAQRAQGALTREESISRREITDACRALHMEPPHAGRTVDMDKAKKQKRTLARLYHPDMNSGNESMKAAYQSVVDAFILIELYNEQVKTAVKPAKGE